MSSPTTMHRASDPEIVRKRADEYHFDRIATLYGGIHPMKSRVPAAGDLVLKTNDYLCLARHPRMIHREIAALLRDGHGDAISRVWAHHIDGPLNRFERRVAALMQAEDGVLCGSGYMANVGVVQALAKPGSPVYIDLLAHIPLWEGITAAKAKPVPFRHNDAGHLVQQIAKHGPGLVLVDALYSTNGDLCELKPIAEAAELSGCALVLDETHSFGTHGPQGSGYACALGLADRVPFRTVGFSKAVPSRGGIIVCSQRNAELLRYEALPAVFSTSVLPHEVACYDAVLDIFAEEPWRQARLHDCHAKLRSSLLELGYNVVDCRSQIISLESGDYETTIRLRDALEARGVFGAIFFPPATSSSRCSIRFTLHCNLSNGDVDRLVWICSDIRDEIQMSTWRSTRKLLGRSAASAGEHAQPAERTRAA